MNSQKKQSSSSRATGIKTDKYGVPLNYGNYKNGRLVVKKSGGGGGGRGRGGGRGSGGGGRGGRGGRGGSKSTKPNGGDKGKSKGSHQNMKTKHQISAQPKQNKKRTETNKNNKEKKTSSNSNSTMHIASVGLTGEAHNVIKEALFSSSLSNTNLPSLTDHDQDNTIRTSPLTSNTKTNTNTNTNTNTTRNCNNPDSSPATNNQHNNNNNTKTTSTATSTRRPNNNRTRQRSSPDLNPPPMISCNNNDDPMGPLGEIRRKLPVYHFKEALLQTIANNRVTVVEGETGSGKTTQVPQFCLEDAATQGRPCNIIIAQPRRISAMSVAERVAAERGEPIGTTVGYTIRLESKATTNTRLLFCTTGILLKRLEEDPLLQNVTHVFVDEVHERSIESDFLLMVLRDLLPKRTVERPLKVILMSATLDASLFHDYFWKAPSFKFPGRTFPVTELYLEDILEVTHHVVKGNEEWCRKGSSGGGKAKRGGGAIGGGNTKEDTNKKPGDWTCKSCQANNFARNQACFKCQKSKQHDPTTGGSGGRAQPPQNPVLSVALKDRDDMELTPPEIMDRYAQYSSTTQAALTKLDHNVINYDLVVETIQWLCQLQSPLEAVNYVKSSNSNSKNTNATHKNKNKKNNKQQQNKKNTNKNTNNESSESNNGLDTTSSAILVFLPGIKEISTLRELLVQSMTSQADRDWVLPIHSTIPPEEQRLVFTRPPQGVRKVVLATNIAETAITIDDVAFVVDAGRMKENRYDPLKRMSSLEDCLVARSNARQRRGRAGRVRAGVAVHLFTKHRHDTITMAAQAPEVQRVPLEQLVLRIKALHYPGTAAEVCARLVEPPAPRAVQRAVEELVFLEAMTLTNNESRNSNSNSTNNNINSNTQVEELTALGVHLSTLPVDCRIGKLILLGAMFGVTDDALTIAATLSYRNPFMSPMSAREEADRAKMTFATGQSDHLTVLNAYKQVDVMGKARYEFCRENFLSIKTLQTIAGLKRQFLELLSAAGFVRPNLRSRAVEALGRRNGGTDGVALALEQGVGSFGGGGKKGVVAPGDWKCLHCKVNNFSRNTRSCFKCKHPKPVVEEQQQQPINSIEDAIVETEQEPRVLLGADDGDDEHGIEQCASLLKALLVAALFPQMVIVDDGNKSSGGKRSGGGGGGMTLKARPEDGEKQEEMALHPSCITGKSRGVLSSKYLVYHERVKTTRVYIRDATPVSPYALILFGGGKMEVKVGSSTTGGSDESFLRLDGWLSFKCPRRDHLLVMTLRKELDEILKHKVANPKEDFTEAGAGIMDAVKAILTMDEDGKVMAPERRRVNNNTNNDVLKRMKSGSNGGGRNSNSNSHKKSSGRGGSKGKGGGGGRGGRGKGGGRGGRR